MDTRYDVDIMRNMDTKNRNMVRKALKNGVYVVQDQGRYLNEFIDIYTETMERDKADRYYFFNKDYYEFLIREMPENVRFFYAYMNGKMISCAIILYSCLLYTSLKKESNYRTDYLMLGCSFLNMIGVCYILQYILNN